MKKLEVSGNAKNIVIDAMFDDPKSYKNIYMISY